VSRAKKNPPPQVLLVDDAASFRLSLRRVLVSECSAAVVEAKSALDALTKLVNGLADTVDIVVADERMPRGGEGSVLLEAIGERWPHIKRLMVTAFSDGELVANSPWLVLDKALDLGTIASYICDSVGEAA
jgi:DNA-binding NarL/FixJ family response regulator